MFLFTFPENHLEVKFRPFNLRDPLGAAKRRLIESCIEQMGSVKISGHLQRMSWISNFGKEPAVFFVKNEDLGTKHMGLCSIDGDHENIWMSPVGGEI